MRAVTNNITNAFIANRPASIGNTTVIVKDNTTELYLYGNLIAKKEKGVTKTTNCGYQTNVTKERLNGLPGVRIQQIKDKWYLNGKEWNGELTQIK